MTAFSKWLPPSARAIHAHVTAASIEGLEKAKALRPYSVVAVKTLSDISSVVPKKKKASFTSKLETIFEGRTPAKYWAPSSCAEGTRDNEGSDVSDDECKKQDAPVDCSPPCKSSSTPPKASLVAKYGGPAKRPAVATHGFENVSLSHAVPQSAFLRYGVKQTKPQLAKDHGTTTCIQHKTKDSAQMKHEPSQGPGISSLKKSHIGDSSEDESSSDEEIEMDFQEVVVAGSGIAAVKALRS
eukprot:gnl/MRDRNA2_/MRDRNA2_123113_c0_seq1.p1 gnl/MRDRNA2_/MRDRNA2_123113_c0~~gnl/MRDRNA2_/MRDRNA2_123113_c0_seq1.p1  ORF type:complete len:255 (-),score=51.18 gnl/MRDRNA2_/MRDRNA2_123113_c0_seq1:124-846(-)